MIPAQSGITIGDAIVAALDREPDRIAFVWGDRRPTYREIADRVFQMARALVSLGLKPGQGLSSLLSSRPEAFVLRAASAMIGCRHTALNPMGAMADHGFALADAEIELLVTEDSLGEAAHRAVKACGRPVRMLSFGGGAAPDPDRLAGRESGASLAPAGAEDDVTTISYTGGTTGRPKGVMQTHRVAVQNLMMTLAGWQLPREMRTLLCTPLSHAAGTMVLPTLIRGGTVHLLPKFDPDRVLDTIERERITCILGVPTMIYALLQNPRLGTLDLASLESFIYGSAPMAPAKLAEALERIGPIFSQLYAQSEAPMTVTYLRREDHDLRRPHLLASCGQPMLGVRVALLDDNDGEVPVGAEGEICIRSRLVMHGYWRNPEATAQALRGGWLHTGDIARRDDRGYLYIVDRKHDMIVSGGFNVYPREVEDIIARHPGVAACAVIGVPDEKWGEAVKAFVLRRADAGVDADALLALVRDAKGPIATPKSVDFVSDLPLTPVGKVDKQALRQPYWKDRSRRVN